MAVFVYCFIRRREVSERSGRFCLAIGVRAERSGGFCLAIGVRAERSGDERNIGIELSNFIADQVDNKSEEAAGLNSNDDVVRRISEDVWMYLLFNVVECERYSKAAVG